MGIKMLVRTVGLSVAVAGLALLSTTAAGASSSGGVGKAPVDVVSTQSKAKAATGRVMVTTQRMSGPSLTTTQYGWYAAGTVLTLDCYAYGQAVRGWGGGPSSLWYRTSTGFVADIDLATGSDGPITAACGSAAPTTSTRESRAVSWAMSMVGSQAYAGACERFVENAFGTSGRYYSALTAFKALRAAGTMRYTRTSIPAGMLVFSDGPVDGPYGHVMLSIGGGQFVSGGANGPTVKVFTTPNPGSTFLGWSPAPASWRGR